MNATLRTRLVLFAVATAALVTLTALGGCSSARSRRVLSFFFDGVPTEHARNRADSIAIARRNAVLRMRREQERADSLRRANASVHPPYAEKDCTACHEFADESVAGSGKAGMPMLSLDRASGQGWLLEPPEELCFECHDDKTAEAAEAEGKMIHSPVEDGECIECHNPHLSPNRHLLRAARVRTLCFGCHDEEIADGVDDHPELDEDEDCTDCHNPHMSEDEYLLE